MPSIPAKQANGARRRRRVPENLRDDQVGALEFGIAVSQGLDPQGRQGRRYGRWRRRRAEPGDLFSYPMNIIGHCSVGHGSGLARGSAVTPARRSRRRGNRASSTKKKLPPAGDVNLTSEGTPLRDIERLIAVDDSAWSHLQQTLAESDALTLPVDPERGRRSLCVGLQVTAASTM